MTVATPELSLGPKLALPLEVVTRTTGIVGQRGTGKTSTAVVLVEEASAVGAQCVVIDPTGAWYGLRSSSDGKGPGLDVVVLGGHNGDLPIDPEAGGIVAKLIVEERLSAVLDLERMTKGQQLRFVAEFCEQLYHHNRAALLLVADEAHRFAPQQLRDPGGYGARCLGALTDVVTLGRRKGLGVVLISQRPAKINKDVLEQAEVLIAHRLMGPNDRKALSGWMEEAAADVEGAPGLDVLPKLGRGEAVVWAPTLDVFGRFQIRAKTTFDSSATPEVGGSVVVPEGRAPVDLDMLRGALAAAVQRAEEEDPRALRRRIKELEASASATTSQDELDQAYADARKQGYEVGYEKGFSAAMAEAHDVVGEALDHARSALSEVRPAKALSPVPSLLLPSAPPLMSPAPPEQSRPARPASRGDLPKAAEELIRELVAFPDGIPRERLALLAGKKPRGGSWNTAMKALAEAGLTEQAGDLLVPTEKALATYPIQSLRSPADLLAMWRPKLGLAAREILDALAAHSRPLSPVELGEATGRAPRGGSWNTAIKELKTAGLVVSSGAGLALHEDLAG